MSDRDPQIDNIKDPEVKKMALASRGETQLDFGMTGHTGVNLEKFAELVREQLRSELAREASVQPAAARSPKP
jgi:hypothetical protein